MKNKVKIPVAFQIRIDDVAWHNGADERYAGKPSRTGMPRKHVAEDYPILNELGKAINQKIQCSIVLGEWDKDNILRGQNEFTWCPDTWDRKGEMDMEYHEKAFDALENSEYIAYTCHGVMHGHYDRGRQVMEREFYNLTYNAETDTYDVPYVWHTDEMVKKHLDYFFKLYDMWGFKKPVLSFACGNGNIGSEYDEGNMRYAEIFKEYGFKYWENGWGEMTHGTSAAVIEGIVALTARGAGNIPWNAFDIDPDFLPLFNTEDEYRTDYCIHWPNLLRWNPEHNLEYLPKWVNYFNKQAEVFGTMIARDIEFAASQAVYNKHTKITYGFQNDIKIFLNEVDAQNALALKDEFYISFKNDLVPDRCIGGEIELYEEKKEFKTYRISRGKNKKIEIFFK